MMDTKICRHCEGAFRRRAKETPANWQKRVCCSHTCAKYSREWSPADPEASGMTKACAYCSEQMARKHREQRAEWLRRRYCSPACASRDWAKRQKEQPVSRIENDEESEFAMSWDDIGAELGITGEYARRIFIKAIKKLRKACEEHGVSHKAIYLSRAA